MLTDKQIEEQAIEVANFEDPLEVELFLDNYYEMMLKTYRAGCIAEFNQLVNDYKLYYKKEILKSKHNTNKDIGYLIGRLDGNIDSSDIKRQYKKAKKEFRILTLTAIKSRFDKDGFISTLENVDRILYSIYHSEYKDIDIYVNNTRLLHLHNQLLLFNKKMINDYNYKELVSEFNWYFKNTKDCEIIKMEEL